MIGRQISNRHHYLPEFYLKQWSATDSMIVRFHRPRDRVVVSRHSAKGTGYEFGLYSLEGESDPDVLEQEFFKPVDNAAAPILVRLINDGPAGFDGLDRTRWARFVMSLQLRGPHSISELREGLYRTLREVIVRTHGLGAFEAALVQEPEQIANFHKACLPEFIDNAVNGSLLINMRWAVFVMSGGTRDLLTGDRPYLRWHGMGDPRCYVSVPISPTHLFVAANAVETLRALAKQPRKDTVRNANDQIIRMAVQNVYATALSHREFVEARLRRNGEPIPGSILGD